MKFDIDKLSEKELRIWASKVYKMALKSDISTDNYDCWENHEELSHFILNGCKRKGKTTLSEKKLLSNCKAYWKWRMGKEK